jgi:hypothetical protein
MPFAFEEIALWSQVEDNSADFMGVIAATRSQSRHGRA